MEAYLATHFPELLEELDGLAEGAGVPAERVRLASISNALASLPREGETEPPPIAGCSQVALGKTERGPAVLKTDDLRIGQPAVAPEEAAAIIAKKPERLFVARAHPSHGLATLVLSDWGTLWTECGVNERGLALGQSSGRPALLPQDGRGIPQHLLPTLLLSRCADVEEAAEFALSHPVAGKGINIVLVDALGRVLVMEKCGRRTGLVRPPERAGYCTNHYRTAVLAAETRRQLPDFQKSAYFGDSSARAEMLRAALAGNEDALGFSGLLRIAKSHPRSGAICKHGTTDDAGLTGFSAVALSRERRLLFNYGPSCRGEFRAIDW